MVDMCVHDWQYMPITEECWVVVSYITKLNRKCGNNLYKLLYWNSVETVTYVDYQMMTCQSVIYIGVGHYAHNWIVTQNGTK